jgi:hypothetical protein
MTSPTQPTADAKVELVARAIYEAEPIPPDMEWLCGYEQQKELNGPGWILYKRARAAITALEASPHMRTEAITRENRMLRRKLAELGCELIDNVDDHIAMQAARPIAPETKAELAKLPCETTGPEDAEVGCCGPCRARAELSTPIAPVQDDDAEKLVSRLRGAVAYLADRVGQK